MNGHAPQTLRDHIIGVANKSQSNARIHKKKGSVGNTVRYEYITRLCALVHDLIKCTKRWQEYCPNIDGEVERREKIDHATGGAIWLCKRRGLHETITTGKIDVSKSILFEIVTLCSISHHSGLMDTYSVPDASYTTWLSKRMQRYISSSAFDSELAEIDIFVTESNLVKQIDSVYALALEESEYNFKIFTEEHKDIKLSTFMLIKFVFSCLVDADHQDAYDYQVNCITENYGGNLKKKYVDLHKSRIRHPTKGLLSKLDDYYAENITPNIDKYPINGMRNEYRDISSVMSMKRKGFFKAFGPTGIGKHLSLLNFSLRHAITYNMNRIFMLSPFESIIEQNAGIASDIFNTDNKQAVMEIHSTFDYNSKDYSKKQKRIYKLTKENNDCAIIYASFVRLFDAFLKNKGTSNRILHSLTNSVIILDECQELYIKFLQLECNILNILVEQYGCTVVFCSATIPSIHDINGYIRGNCIDFIDNPIEFESRLNNLRNINIELGGYNNILTSSTLGDTLISSIKLHSNVLCILNTRKAVDAVYNYVKTNTTDTIVIKLSTYECAKHRKDIISNIRKYLDTNVNLCVICTRLIEAGVDVDFTCVYKSVSSIPSIAQALGRCNRNGSRIGYFYLIRLSDEVENTKSMRELEIEKRITTAILNKDIVTLDYALSERYSIDFINNPDIKAITDHHQVYDKVSKYTSGDKSSLINIPNFDSGLKFPFRDISSVNIIEHNQISILVPYNEDAIKLIEYLKENPPLAYHYREIQQYSVNIYETEYRAYMDANLITVINYTGEISADEQEDNSEYMIRILDPIAYSLEEGLHMPELLDNGVV